ncbi:MAG: tetratricopeptide repeat protein [Armatimonadota bacterium]
MKDYIRLFKEGNFSEVIKQLEKVCSGVAPSYEAYLYLGASYAHLERYEDAVKAFSMARELRPDSAAIHYNLGQTYEALELIEEARECYKNAVKLNPTYLPAKTALINLYLHQVAIQDNDNNNTKIAA